MTQNPDPTSGLQRLFAPALPGITAMFDDDDEDDYHNPALDDEPCQSCGEDHGPRDCPYDGCEPGEHCPEYCPYETGHTDWDRVYPHLGPTVHRGMAIHLDRHDPAAPAHTTAHRILDAISDDDGLGTHWSTSERQGQHYAAVSHRPGHHNLHVVLHAATPARHDIEDDPHELLRQDVIGFDQHPDAEIPIRRNRPVAITGVSWKDPDARDWTRHDLAQPVSHRAVLQADAGGKPWLPHDRFFGPGHPDLDPRLFDGDHLKPAWRRALLKLVNAAFADHTYGVPGSWQRWAHAYLAGSQASHWYGNNDLDVLIGIDYDAYRRARPADRHLTDRQIDERLNADAHRMCDPARWFTIAGQHLGPFDSTLYVNPDSHDIRDIKPYAAYCLDTDRWAVKPVVVPDDFGPESLPGADFLYARSLASQVRALRKLPAGQAQALGAALYDQLHAQRHDAFGHHGGGLYDVRNVAWKYLDQHPDKPMEHLVGWKRAQEEAPGVSHAAILKNPRTREVANRGVPDVGRTWFHGTHAVFDRPDVHHEPDTWHHWNTTLGSHWTSNHAIANRFSFGGGVGKGRVLHAHLDINNPRHYDSEYDMDREAYGHEYEAGNHYDQHTPGFTTRHRDHPVVGHTNDLREQGDDPLRFAFWLSNHPDREGIASRFKQRLIDAGHDGIVYGNELERVHRKTHPCAIPFSPDQVQVTQTHGSGSCPPADPAGSTAPQGHTAGMSGPGSDADFGKRSMMIALVPPREVAERLELADGAGEPADQMHVTLAYLPEVAAEDIADVTRTVAAWAARLAPMRVRIAGAGTFVADPHVLYAAVDIPNASHVHSGLIDALEAAGFAPSRKFGFTAHMTLGYNRHHWRFLPKITPETFDCHYVWVCRGKDWRPVPLGGATATNDRDSSIN